MKKYFVLLLFSCFLISSCSKKNEVVIKETPTLLIPPVADGNFMECSETKRFIKSINEVPPKERPYETRANIRKYKYNDQFVYFFYDGDYWTDGLGIVIDGACNVVCPFTHLDYSVCDDFGKAEFIEEVWRDNR